MPPRADYDMPAWVLGTFDQADGRAVTDAIRRSVAAAREIVLHGTAAAANLYNSSDFNPEAR